MSQAKSSIGQQGGIIFLSYRRADSAPQTFALKLELDTRLQTGQVFVDTRAVQVGDDWSAEIQSALRAAKVVIPIIGRNWEGKNSQGKPRINDPSDWVRREISFALRYKRDAIVPLRVDGRKPLDPQKLPKPLRKLAAIESRPLNLHDWESQVGSLVARLWDRFGFKLKQETIRYPKPSRRKAKLPPVSWKRLQRELDNALWGWRVEFLDDPEHVHNKRMYLTCDFECRDFAAAKKFIQMIMTHAEKKDHHPRLRNIHRTVTVQLSTWDRGHKITKVDIDFARVIEQRHKQYR